MLNLLFKINFDHLLCILGSLYRSRDLEGERKFAVVLAEEAGSAPQDPDGGGAAAEAGGRQRPRAAAHGAAQHGIQPGMDKLSFPYQNVVALKKNKRAMAPQT